ncbi:MAG: hypothetical protein ABSG83_15410 [Roseiarcus sp.]
MSKSRTSRLFAIGGRSLAAVALIALIGLALVAAWRLAARSLVPSASLHYKLSIDIDDNGVLRHGAGVVEVGFQSQGPVLIGNTPQWSASTIGEAFWVDIGECGTLVVTLVGEFRRSRRDPNATGVQEVGSTTAVPASLLAYFNFDVTGLPNGLESKAKIDAFAASGARVDINPYTLPLLLRFCDLKDPSSLEVVDPDDLAASFGAGVRLIGARVEITNEPLTSGIRERLPWLKLGYREKYLVRLRAGSAAGETDEQVITYGDFWSSTR